MSRILLRMSKELSKELSSPSSTCLNYGDEAGNKPFLPHLASYIGPDCDVKNLFVTNGISHGLDMLTAVLRPSDPNSSFVVFVEKVRQGGNDDKKPTLTRLTYKEPD